MTYRDRVSPDKRQALNALNARVEKELMQGRRPDQIVKGLTQQGLSEKNAVEVVRMAQYASGNNNPWPGQRKVLTRQHFAQMIMGALMVIVAIAFTIGSYIIASKVGASVFFVGTGIFIGGIANFFRGLFGWLKNQ
jgi:hypothetical protein